MIPHFRLSTPLTRGWALNRDLRHRLAAWLAHQYPRSGVAVVTDSLAVVAWVNPLGQIKFATPPFARVPRHLCANNPTWQACECRRWYDAESRGPWAARGSPRHHPLCIFDELALGRWREVQLPEKVVRQALDGGFLHDGERKVPDGSCETVAPARSGVTSAAHPGGDSRELCVFRSG